MAKVEDKNGFWFIEHNPITKTGVYDYLGKQISPECEPNKIYKVLRPKEELFKKETLDSLRLIPIVNDHTMIGTGFTAPEDKGLDGTLGDNVSHDTDTIYNDLKIISNKMKEEIQNGKKELSLGYFCRYDKQPGTYKGQRYDYVQRDIIANHLALVDKGRMGADVRVYDSKNIPEGEAFAMDSIDIAADKEFNESDVNRDDRVRFATKGSSGEGGGEYKIGEKVKVDSNWRGVFPKIAEGEIIERRRSLAGKSDPNPDHEIKIKQKDGSTFWINESAIVKQNKQTGNKAELKKGDKIRFADTQGVEYKFVGENRGMLEFENIDDDSDKKGFPKGQLEERLKDGSMQISGSSKAEPEKSEWDKERDKENERHEKLMKKLKKEIEEATDPQEIRDLREHRNGMIKEHNRRLDQIFEDEEKSQKAGNSEPENLTEEQKESAKEVFKRVYGGNNTPFQEKKWNELYKDYYNNMSDKSIHQLYEDLKNGKFDYKDYGENSFVREEIFGRIADAEGVKYNDIYEMWLKSGEKSEPEQAGKDKGTQDSMEYKTIQGEGKMADKKEKVAIDEDKRKLIDEIGGILKDEGLDDEIIRTVIGKAEKIAYNKSEAGDDGEEVEEVIEEQEEKAGKDCGKKAAKDKCGKDKDEEEVEEKEDVVNKVEEKEDVVNKVVEKKGMDENDVIKVIARKDKLAKAVAKVIGTFDHSEMTEQQVAEYACDKLDLPVKKGEEITGINCYLKSLPKERIIFSYGMDSASKEDAEFEKFQNKGE